MYKVLLIGEGGRESAIAKALKKSEARIFSFMSAKNPGISRLSEKIKIGNLKDIEAIADFAISNQIDFAICGPEMPLVEGVANKLISKGIPCVGPLKELAMIEGSKAFARSLLKKHKIEAYPEFKIISNIKEAESAMKEIQDFVVKPDGLTGGKGVKVLGEHIKNIEDALKYCEKVLESHRCVVIEEKMKGEEYVLQCFSDGKTIIPMPLVQDHKRAYDDDKGENTGGMGSISSKDHLLPFINHGTFEKSMDIMKKSMEALQKEIGMEYKGIIYGQFMITKNGPKIVEFNVRFGDPEAMNVLSLLDSSFLDICYDIIYGNLKKDRIIFQKLSTVCVYFAPEGYPSNPLKNEPIYVDENQIEKLGAELFYASLNEVEGKFYTTGSRSLAILAKAEEITEASKICYKASEHVKGRLHFRRDIGSEELLNKRINNLRKLGIFS